MKHQYMIRVLLFVAYQGTRIWTSDTTVVTIPTADMKRGIFGTTNIYDPVNVVNGARVQFANNMMPAAHFDAVAAKLISLYRPNPKKSFMTPRPTPMKSTIWRTIRSTKRC